METICNSIYLILEAVSQFDITKIDNSNVVMTAQIIVDIVRFVKLFF